MALLVIGLLLIMARNDYHRRLMSFWASRGDARGSLGLTGELLRRLERRLGRQVANITRLGTVAVWQAADARK